MEKAALQALADQMIASVREHVRVALNERVGPLEARLTRLEATNAVLRDQNDALKAQLALFDDDERSRSDERLRAVK